MDYLFFALCFMYLCWIFLRIERLYTFPGTIAATSAVFLGPQFIGLYSNPYPVSTWAIELTSLLACTGLIICYLSYRNYKPACIYFHIQSLNLNEDLAENLFYLGLLYSLVGTSFMVALGSLPTEDLALSQWSGKTVLYLFFARLIYPGFALIFFSVLSKPSNVKWLLCLSACIYPIIRFVLFGRRTELLIFVSIVALGIFFIKKYIPPRILFIIFSISFALFIFSVGEYRASISNIGINVYDINAILRFDWLNDLTSSIFSIDWTEGLRNSSGGDHPSELKYAASVVESTYVSGEYGFGTHYWNKFIHAYIPSQLLGKDFKNSLMLPSPDFVTLSSQYFGQSIYENGLTSTIVAEQFSQFSVLSPLLYIPVSRFFKWIWSVAVYQQNLIFQIFYALIIHTAAIAVVGGFANMINQIIYYLVFLTPVFLITRLRKSLVIDSSN